MGTLAALAPILGLVSGHFIARLTPDEWRAGQSYFLLAQHALLALVVSMLGPTLLWQASLAALLLGFFFYLSFAHPFQLVPFLGILSAYVPAAHIPLFLYFLVIGGHYSIKHLSITSALYALVAIAFSQL